MTIELENAVPHSGTSHNRVLARVLGRRITITNPKTLSSPGILHSLWPYLQIGVTLYSQFATIPVALISYCKKKKKLTRASDNILLNTPASVLRVSARVALFLLSSFYPRRTEATRKLRYLRAAADTGRNLTNIRCRRPRASMSCESIKRDGPYPMHERARSSVSWALLRSSDDARRPSASRTPGDVLLDGRTCPGVNSHG